MSDYDRWRKHDLIMGFVLSIVSGGVAFLITLLIIDSIAQHTL